MAEQDSTVVGSEQTPASTGAVEASTDLAPATTQDTQTDEGQSKAVSDPFADRSDPWDTAIAKAISEETDKTAAEPVAEKAASDEGAKQEPAAEEPAKEPEKPAEEKSEEDQLLEEAFAEGDKAEPKEEQVDLDKLDPAEQIERQRNKHAKAWAERNARWAEPVKMLLQPDVAISEVASKLEEQHQERYAALSQHAAHKLVDENPDATFQRAFAVRMLKANPGYDVSQVPTLDDVIARLNGAEQTAKPAEPVSQAPAATSELSALTAELDKSLTWDWRDPKLDGNFVDDRERSMATALRQMEAKAQQEAQAKSEFETKLKEQQSELEKLRGEVDGVKKTAETEQHEALRETLDTTIADYRKSVQDKFLPHVLASTGLEISKEDTPEIQAFKQLRQELFTGTSYEKANGLDSAFETFAFHESSVKGQLEEVAKRVVDAQFRESQAKMSRQAADAAKYHKLAEDEKIPLLQLLAQASKEFKKTRIDPDLRVLGLHSERTAKPLEEAAKRVEIVANGAGTPSSKAPKPNYRTAEDVWDSAVAEAKREESLRAGA